MARFGWRRGLRMLFLMGLAVGAVLMILAQRRAEAIRLRVEQRWGHRRPSSWEGWRRAMLID
jgi:hypothetical protein